MKDSQQVVILLITPEENMATYGNWQPYLQEYTFRTLWQCDSCFNFRAFHAKRLGAAGHGQT